jgi:DUF971 family protein
MESGNFMADQLKPTGITANRLNREMSVQWSDGHASIYNFTLLRLACPCAECRGGHEKMGGDPDPAIFAMPEEITTRTSMVKVEAVGTYGLTIEWEDGHHYGIYNWNYLRNLCPCPLCRE